MLCGSAAAFLVVLACCAVRAVAQMGQPERSFSWQFADGADHRSLQACQDIPIKILPPPNGSFVGSPPYRMLALEGGGVPTSVEIGSDPSNLLWKVDHRHGAVLMLTVVDSGNNVGGIPNTHFTVESSGSDSSCLPPTRDDIAVMTSNVTDLLTTCQPWGLTITGGKKPYTLVLSAFNSPTIVNVTLGPTHDEFTFVNRENSDSQFMASVMDANGQWGKSTPFILTQGSQNIDCPGLVSESSSIPPIPHKIKKAPLIAGLLGGLVLAALIGVHWWQWLRKRAHNRANTSTGTWDVHEPNVDQTHWSPASLTADGMQQQQNSALQRVHVIQHHDADVVEELPPPYAERVSRVPHPDPHREPRRPQKARRATRRVDAVAVIEANALPASQEPSKALPGGL